MKKVITTIIVTFLIIINMVSIYSKLTTDSILTKVFGCGLLVVTSGSMQPEINIGEVILIKQKNDYKVGDIITANVDNYYLLTHRIVEIKDNSYITKGDNNNCIDNKIIKKEEVEGKVIFHSKLLGIIYYYRYLIFLVLIIVLLLLSII